MAEQSTGRSWQDALWAGLGGIIDSQRTMNYAVNDPAYNTQGGRAGQSQPINSLQQAAQSPVVWVVGAAVLALVVVLALKR
jgi:hypothetical protein